MITVFEKLLEIRDEIQCNACGNCCHGFQSACKQLRGDGKCNVHPAILGVEVRTQYEPDCYPEADPFDATHIGYYCLPVIDKIHELTGTRLEPSDKVSPLGKRVYINTDELNLIYARKIES